VSFENKNLVQTHQQRILQELGERVISGKLTHSLANGAHQLFLLCGRSCVGSDHEGGDQKAGCELHTAEIKIKLDTQKTFRVLKIDFCDYVEYNLNFGIR